MVCIFQNCYCSLFFFTSLGHNIYFDANMYRLTGPIVIYWCSQGIEKSKWEELKLKWGDEERERTNTRNSIHNWFDLLRFVSQSPLHNHRYMMMNNNEQCCWKNRLKHTHSKWTELKRVLGIKAGKKFPRVHWCSMHATEFINAMRPTVPKLLLTFSQTASQSLNHDAIYNFYD